MARVRRFTNEGLPIYRWCDTLGKFVAEPEGKTQPVWAEHQFSFAFSGLPPVEVYENYDDLDRG